MNKLGILVSDLSASQLAYTLIKNVNKYLDENYKTDITIFYEVPSVFCLPVNFSCMQIVEAYLYQGTLIATNLNTARKLLDIPSPSKKHFYLWDLEWGHGLYKNFKEIYDSELNLLTRSIPHQKIVKDVWNKDSKVVSNFKIDELVGLL